MFLTDIQPVRARKTDPSTSHAAAKNAERFASSHKGRIMAALAHGPLTAHGISKATGLTVVQVDRRAVELERSGRIEYVKTEDGEFFAVGGFRVWRAVKGGE